MFENFEDPILNPDDLTGKETTKKWMGTVSDMDSRIQELRNVMDLIEEGNQKIREMEAELGMSNLKLKEKDLLEEIRIALASIDKSTHRAHGLILKCRKPTISWNPPSKEEILTILSMQVEGVKELIERLKTETEFKKPSNVSGSIKASYDVKEAEEMEISKPWYKRAFDSFKNWLFSFKKDAQELSIKMEAIVNKLEDSINTYSNENEFEKPYEDSMARIPNRPYPNRS